MLIIIEGCDGVGKTTLAEALADKITELGEPTEVLHYGPPVRHPLDEYEEDLVGYAPGNGLSIITDRYHLGELVYAPLYRKGSPLGGYSGVGRAHVELFLAARGAVVVHVDGNERDVRSRLVERGEDYLDLKDISTVLQDFRKAVATSILPTVRVPMFWGPADVHRILLYAGSKEQMAYYSWSPGYVGPLNPKQLFVTAERSEVPFVPYEDSDAESLMTAIGWRALAHSGFCNAFKADLNKLVSQYRPIVIAVGKGASRMLDHRRIQHGVVSARPTHINVREAAKGKRFV